MFKPPRSTVVDWIRSCAPHSSSPHLYQKDQSTWEQKYRKQLSIPQLLKAVNPSDKTAHFGKWDSRFDDVTPEEMGYDELFNLADDIGEQNNLANELRETRDELHGKLVRFLSDVGTETPQTRKQK